VGKEVWLYLDERRLGEVEAVEKHLCQLAVILAISGRYSPLCCALNRLS
jgi:hypothetical protein